MQKQMEKVQLEPNCSICLRGLNQGHTTDLECPHRFHTSCIKSWEDAAKRNLVQATCPNCRQPIRQKKQFHQQPYEQNSQSLIQINSNPQVGVIDISSQTSYSCSQICALISVSILALLIEGLMLLFYSSTCISLFSNPNTPIFSAGLQAKGYIAIGMYAKGIVAIGMVAQGMFTLSMVGIGLLVFVGQVGGGLGFGIYQVGITWYCYIGQLSVGIWATKRAQIGCSIIAPLCNPQRKHLVDCEG